VDGGIFLSYRREDSAGYAGRLYDRLKGRFPARVFMDVGEIGVGDDFVAAIENRLASCSVLVVLIGPAWNPARLADSGDFVHLEILHGIRGGLKVMPVLLHGARVPAVSELPADLAGLTRLQAIRISDESWDRDAAALIGAIEQVIGKVAPPQMRFAPAAGIGIAAILAVGVWFWWHGRSTSSSAPLPAVVAPGETTVIDVQKRYAGSVANDYNKAADVLDSIGNQIEGVSAGGAATHEEPVSIEKNLRPGERQEIVLSVPGSPHNLAIAVFEKGGPSGGKCPSNPPQPPTPANLAERQCEPAVFHSTDVQTVRVTQNKPGSGFAVMVRIASAATAPMRTIRVSATYPASN